MNSEDFSIHLGPNMPDADRDQLQDIMTALEGVISAYFSDEQKLELVVTYDPQKTNATIISDTVVKWN